MTRRRLYITVILILGVTTAINVDKFFMMALKTGERVSCSSKNAAAVWYSHYVSYWIDALLSSIIPFCIILVGNMIIVSKLAMAEVKRKRIMQVYRLFQLLSYDKR